MDQMRVGELILKDVSLLLMLILLSEGYTQISNIFALFLFWLNFLLFGSTFSNDVT